jgi:hypothetical protein
MASLVAVMTSSADLNQDPCSFSFWGGGGIRMMHQVSVEVMAQ